MHHIEDNINIFVTESQGKEKRLEAKAALRRWVRADPSTNTDWEKNSLNSEEKDLGVLVDETLSVNCTRSPESQLYPGLHQKKSWSAGQGR